MYRIKKIKILPLAYTVTLIYFILGLLLGIFLAIVRTNPSFSSYVGQDLVGLTLVQIVLLYPIAYSAGGFLIGVLVGYIYNQVSKVTGGISVQLVKDKKEKSGSK